MGSAGAAGTTDATTAAAAARCCCRLLSSDGGDVVPSVNGDELSLARDDPKDFIRTVNVACPHQIGWRRIVFPQLSDKDCSECAVRCILRVSISVNRKKES